MVWGRDFQSSCPCFLFSGCSHMSIYEKGHIFFIVALRNGEKKEIMHFYLHNFTLFSCVCHKKAVSLQP